MPPAICIHCLESKDITLSLSGPTAFRCNTCSQAFTTDDVRKRLADLHAAWDERLKWIDAQPAADQK